ncbi:Uncharacterised protein [Mycobacterium tuberculosis]|uniref:Uncharacterized protein n=1 Tax=Mycobacterium tuberculosis TaxID=1773 RepID=A0A0U0S102_MYCTX|nr:Uncharacterised protein [Mycobacterium tuberculosis]COW42383.1 Uncharacterised protein [Mycobacterium tuberculosis]
MVRDGLQKQGATLSAGCLSDLAKHPGGHLTDDRLALAVAVN